MRYRVLSVLFMHLLVLVGMVAHKTASSQRRDHLTTHRDERRINFSIYLFIALGKNGFSQSFIVIIVKSMRMTNDFAKWLYAIHLYPSYLESVVVAVSLVSLPQICPVLIHNLNACLLWSSSLFPPESCSGSGEAKPI